LGARNLRAQRGEITARPRLFLPASEAHLPILVSFYTAKNLIPSSHPTIKPYISPPHLTKKVASLLARSKKLDLATMPIKKATSHLTRPKKLHLTSLDKKINISQLHLRPKWLHLTSAPRRKSYISLPYATEKATSRRAPDQNSYISPHSTEKTTSRHRNRPKKLHFTSPNQKSYISPDRKSYISPPHLARKITSRLA
jgi:hypothetical protein